MNEQNKKLAIVQSNYIPWKGYFDVINKVDELKDYFEELYLGYQEKYLILLNYGFIIEINKLLNITTQISWSMDYDLPNLQKIFSDGSKLGCRFEYAERLKNSGYGEYLNKIVKLC